MPEPGSSAVRRPAPALRPYISHYAGFRAHDLDPGIHAGLPSRHLHLIISLEAPIEIVAMPNQVQHAGRLTALVGGLHGAPALVRRGRSLDLLHVFLEPIGARALLGPPGNELASRVFDLRDVWGAQRANELVDRLRGVPFWQARFDVLDEAFARAVNAVEPSARLLWAWRRLAAGDTPIATLARRVDWSRQHFTNAFRGEFGVTPATARRIFRFEHACWLIKTRQRLADVATACGYYDQAHMTHDWNALAGCTPAAWAARELPFLQDYEFAAGDDERQHEIDAAALARIRRSV
jgi:AraC-like DNA-binding protein